MEIWRDIKGYEGYYRVSNLGEVKSTDRKVERTDKQIRYFKEKIISPYISKCGYQRLALNKNNEQKLFKVSRIVATAFILNPYNYPQVNHKDGNKLNDKADNLEWVNNKMNYIHASKLGLIPIGEGCSWAKLNELQVRVIKKCNDLNTIELAKIFGVTRHNIGYIKNSKRWKHLK